jgi:wobble nucleotide-excising tRNase
MAITFAYFIATLEDEAVDLSKTVVVIDDPVSSLDSNKVHATYGLIADKLWQKSNQLFVLSHHFQFIKLFHGPKQDKIAWYSMQGTSSGQPSIAACPDLITDFQSEYYYLFYRLHHLVPNDSNFYISRNILRRFLEALLEFKFGRGDFRSKLEQWFRDNQLTAEMYGVLNAGSHPNDVDDFSDPRRFREMVYRVCRSIRDRDPDHHTALIRHLNRDVGKCKPPADGTVCALCVLLNEEGASS